MTLLSLGVLQCRERNMEHGDRQDSSAYQARPISSKQRLGR
jgi:hypothetical protein